MKKILTATMTLMMMFTLVAIQVSAGPNCGAKADLAGSKSASCSKMGKEACMAKYGMSEEECKAMSKEMGANCELTQISIKGMTCGNCEKSVTAALEEVPGVVKVINVSYTDGTALVAVNPLLSKDNLLTKAIADKGFSAEIIPAVARSTMTDSKMGSDHCSKSGGKASGKGCCAKGAKATSASATSSDAKTSQSASGDTK